MTPLFIVLVIQAASADTIAEARAAYQDVEHETAMRLLDKAQSEDPSDDDWIAIHELRAIIHVTYDRRAKARQAMKDIILRVPAYSPSDHAPPKILEAYGAARAELSRDGLDLSMRAPPPVPHWYTNKWLWIGVGVAAAAVATYVIVEYNDPDAPRSDFAIIRFGGP